MKRVFKTLSIFLMLFFCAVTLVACGNKGKGNVDNGDVFDGVIYREFYNNRDAYYVAGFKDDVKKDVTIKSSIDGKPVTTIGEEAFKDCERLETIIIPTSIIIIKKNAFNSCDNLKSVTFDEHSTLNKISIGSFANCKSLESFTIPSSVEILESATTETDGIFFESKINTVAFEGNENLTELADYIFYRSQLRTIDLTPLKINKINKYAFSDTPLESIKFNEQLKQISENAFKKSGNAMWSHSYVEITLPKSVEIIEKNAFEDCRFKTVIFEEGIKIQEISSSCFEGSKLKYITIPKSVTKIEHQAFARSLVEKVSFESGSNLKRIAARAFFVCEVLFTFEFPESVEYIGNNAFYRTVYLRDNLSKAIQCKDNSTKYMFIKAGDDIESLSSITNFDKVAVIADNAFVDCYKLKTADLSACSQLITLGNHSFETFSLENVIIPNQVEYIGVKAFADYEDLNIQMVSDNSTDRWDIYKYESEVYKDEYLVNGFATTKMGVISAVDVNRGLKAVLQEYKLEKQGN